MARSVHWRNFSSYPLSVELWKWKVKLSGSGLVECGVDRGRGAVEEDLVMVEPESRLGVGGQKQERKWCFCLKRQVRSFWGFVEDEMDL